ncbi:MAG: diguanylate cyclase [Vicinamibacterales bacterium]
MPAPNRASSLPSRRRDRPPAEGRAAALRTVRPAAHARPYGAGEPDFAARLAEALPALREQLRSRQALHAMIQAVNSSLDPAAIARQVVALVATWLRAPCVALVSSDDTGQLSLLAEGGLEPAMGPAVFAIAGRLMEAGGARLERFASADLSRDRRLRDDLSATVLAVPLLCRRKRVGALLALDRRPSAHVPDLSPAGYRALRVLTNLAAAAIHNAIQLKRALELSVTDDLTRLYNSRYLNQVLRHETKRASRGGRPLSLLFIDLDGFKAVNDTHGHLCGSRALVEAAAVIRASARETDIVARFGGDEFALVLPDTGADGAFAVGERIRRRIAAHHFLAADGLDIRLTASVGLATLPDVATSSEELIHAADGAMYRVKRVGKNGIRAAGSSR